MPLAIPETVWFLNDSYVLGEMLTFSGLHNGGILQVHAIAYLQKSFQYSKCGNTEEHLRRRWAGRTIPGGNSRSAQPATFRSCMMHQVQGLIVNHHASL